MTLPLTAMSPRAASTPDASWSAAGMPLRARVPADVDAPDRVAFDLTARQLAVLAVTALAVWELLVPLGRWLPAAVRAGVLVPIAGVALALAVGRRDGLPLDARLFAAGMFRHRPHQLVPAPVHEPPAWAPVPTPSEAPSPNGAEPPSLLRLPAAGRRGRRGRHHPPPGPIGESATVLVGATTVNVTLRTPTEQAGLVAGFGRWLNGLTGPVQIVVSTRRVDLPAHATRLIDRARHLKAQGWDGLAEGWDGLGEAASDHAAFLLDLAEDRDPLARTVTVAAVAHGGPAPAVAARRTAEHTVAGLSALGAEALVLDGATVTAVLAAAGDLYQAGDAGWDRIPPGGVVTADLASQPTPAEDLSGASTR